MTEQALKARNRATDELEAQLQSTRKEKQEVERAEVEAAEESGFLADQVQALAGEKAALKAAVERLERERQFLADENALLRQEMLGARAGGGAWVGGGARARTRGRWAQLRCVLPSALAWKHPSRAAAWRRGRGRRGGDGGRAGADGAAAGGAARRAGALRTAGECKHAAAGAGVGAGARRQGTADRDAEVGGAAERGGCEGGSCLPAALRHLGPLGAPPPPLTPAAAWRRASA